VHSLPVSEDDAERLGRQGSGTKAFGPDAGDPFLFAARDQAAACRQGYGGILPGPADSDDDCSVLNRLDPAAWP
jgi:hypothetical protein